jgi:hypothetical protein
MRRRRTPSGLLASRTGWHRVLLTLLVVLLFIMTGPLADLDGDDDSPGWEASHPDGADGNGQTFTWERQPVSIPRPVEASTLEPLGEPKPVIESALDPGGPRAPPSISPTLPPILRAQLLRGARIYCAVQQHEQISPPRILRGNTRDCPTQSLAVWHLDCVARRSLVRTGTVGAVSSLARSASSPGDAG